MLHFLDAGTARRVVDGFTRSLAPGSYMIISVGFGKGLFDGLELVPPGIVDCATGRETPPSGPDR